MITGEVEINVQKCPKRRLLEGIDSRDSRYHCQAESWTDARAGRTGAVTELGFFHLSQGLALKRNLICAPRGN
jgi:hypothetical protein